jgi:hypothetical protein
VTECDSAQGVQDRGCVGALQEADRTLPGCRVGIGTVAVGMCRWRPIRSVVVSAAGIGEHGIVSARRVGRNVSAVGWQRVIGLVRRGLQGVRWVFGRRITSPDGTGRRRTPGYLDLDVSGLSRTKKDVLDSFLRTTDQKVRGSNPFGCANKPAGHLPALRRRFGASTRPKVQILRV